MNALARSRRGFSLIELLCVITLLTVLTGALGLLLNETLEAERLQTEGYDRFQRSRALADQFRADVARAEKAPAKWQEYVADSATLILQLKNRDHLVYHWHEGTLRRLTFENGEENERALPVPGRMSVEFDRAAPDVKLVRLRLLTVRFGNAVPGQTLEIAAAVGGDWR